MQVSTTVSFFLAALSALLAGQSAIALEPCEVQTLTTGGPPLSDAFGGQVAISGDYVAVSAHVDNQAAFHAGAVYVYKREGFLWNLQTKLIASDAAIEDGLGYSVAMDGDRIVAGAPDVDRAGGDFGAAYVFRREGSTWVEETKLVPSISFSNDEFGNGAAIRGDLIVVGAPGTNFSLSHAFVFRWNGTAWIEEAVLIGSDTVVNDRFGEAVGIGQDYVVVGAWLDDEACPKESGCNSGSAYVFRYDGGTWVEETKLIASDGAAGDFFGLALAVSGDHVVVAVPGDDNLGSGSGSAYVFFLDQGNWIQQSRLVSTDLDHGDSFGRWVAIEGDHILVGAPFDDTEAGVNSGSAYFFTRDGTGWTQAAKVIPPNTPFGLEFGSGLALSSDWAVVGAPAVSRAHVYGLTPVPPCIPTISQWGMGALTLTIVIVGTVVIRRRDRRNAPQVFGKIGE